VITRHDYRWRLATPADVPAIEGLIAASARALCSADYPPAVVEAALGTAWGCDTELIRDGTYFLAESDGRLAACGGWGKRKTLFGGDRRAGRESILLDPAADAARIRAFFVHPDFARRGLAREMLARCEAAATAAGFRAAELMATLTGVPFYLAHGYAADERIEFPLPGGFTIAFVPMRKSFGH
jgi:GNAT superfamily N-acetyltransferase